MLPALFTPRTLRQLWSLAIFLSGLCMCVSSARATVAIFSTAFETNENYSTNFDLIGQNGWTGIGSGGNGILDDFLPGFGQQAYIGYDAPALGDDFLSVGRPLNYYPLSSNTPVVIFSTALAVIPSSNGHNDAFYWSLYNAQNQRLFVLDFDNSTSNILYALDGTNNLLHYSGWSFSGDAYYPLVITMDFASNCWSATLTSVTIITNQPITTAGAERSLGYIAAEWAVETLGTSGDNYMLFDNYQITATPKPVSPQLRVTARTGTSTSLRLSGPSNFVFAIETSTNLISWSPLNTNTIASTGFFDFNDTGTAGTSRRFYRARWVP